MLICSKSGWLIELLVILATSFNKISVLLLYLRLINIFNNRNLLWAIRACLAFVVVYMLVFTIFPLAKCTPISANWDKYDPGYTKSYTCIDNSITWPLAAAINAATDLAAVIIPLVILSGLRKPMKQKIGLYSVFAVGFLYVTPAISLWINVLTQSCSVVGAGIARTILVTQMVGMMEDFTCTFAIPMLFLVLGLIMTNFHRDRRPCNPSLPVRIPPCANLRLRTLSSPDFPGDVPEDRCARIGHR